MSITAQGFSFEVPAGFTADATTFALKPAERSAGAQPTLIFHTRTVAADATLDALASEAVSELAAASGKVPRVTDFTFSDGAKGMLVMHAQSTPAGNVRQYLVIRLGQATQATLMVNVPDVPELQASAPLFMQAFASLRAD